MAGQEPFLASLLQLFLAEQQFLQESHLHSPPLPHLQSAGQAHLQAGAQLLFAAGVACGSAAIAVKQSAVAAKVRNNFFIVCNILIFRFFQIAFG